MSIEKFLTSLPGKRYVPRQIAAKITQQGDLLCLEGIDAIIRSLANLLLIAKETYPFDPPLGVGMHEFIFEPTDHITHQQISLAIKEAISRYETRADIDFTVLFFKNKKGFRINLFVDYEGEKSKTSLDIDETMLKTLD